MDTRAYLQRQGWQGDGHSLDHSGRGIKKPLLVSKKLDFLGIGVNKHAAVSDQWWMRAFDQGLKNLGTGKETALASVQKHGIHHGSLYARFVKGEGVPGTIGELSAFTSAGQPADKKSASSRKGKTSKKGSEADAPLLVGENNVEKERAIKLLEMKLAQAVRKLRKLEKDKTLANKQQNEANKQKWRKKKERYSIKLQSARSALT